MLNKISQAFWLFMDAIQDAQLQRAKAMSKYYLRGDE